MGKLKKTTLLSMITLILITSMCCAIQTIPDNNNTTTLDSSILKESPDPASNMENTLNFIIDRLLAIRNSPDFQVTQSLSPDSFNLQATASDETINIDESYEVKNIVNPDPINQTSTTWAKSPTNQTDVTIIMGYTYQLVYYKWEISYELNVFGYKIAYAYFGIEIDIGAGIRFPINVSIEYPQEILVDQLTSVNISLQTLDLPNFNETYFHFIARIYAGISAFGLDGEWSIGPDYRFDRSYETPLGPAQLVDLGTIEIPLLEILGQLAIPTISQVAATIAQYVTDILLKFRFSVGSNLLTMQAKIFGNDTHFDGATGPSSKILNFTQSETQNMFIYTKNPGNLRLELSDFKYYLNKLQITILLGLTWKTVFAYIFDDMEWEIYTFSIPLGNLFVFPSSNTATVQMNATSVPPAEIYDVDVVYISSMETIELAKDIAEYFIVIDNTGQNIEHDIYDIQVTGLDPSWVIYPPEITIKQGASGYFTLQIDPPREISSTAGIHPFTVTAMSRGDPTKNSSITGSLNILPYYESKVERTSLLEWGIVNITPEVTENVSFSITNTGNTIENFTLSMQTTKLNSSIFEVPSMVTLAPGESITIYPNITVPKSPDFPALRYSVKLIAQSEKDQNAIAYDTVQMKILPYKNLSISIVENSVPDPILAGTVLMYDVHVENNGNFNDTIELSVFGLSPEFYNFDIDSQILFPGQILDTTLTITVPETSMGGETLDLKFIAQFASNSTIQIESSFTISTAPNYWPLIITLIIVGIVAAGTPYYYRGVKEQLIPYVKRKRTARIVRKYRKDPDEIQIKIDYCVYCSRKLSEVDKKLLDSDRSTFCEKCGELLTPAHTVVWVPKQKSIDEVVSNKMQKVVKKEELERKKQEVKEAELRRRKETDEKIRQYKEKLKTGPLPKLTMEFCPHCFKKLSDLDTRLLQKGDNTWCPHCKKFIEPKEYEKK